METKRQQIERIFTYHPPRPGNKERYESITDKFLEMALFVYDNTPESSEQKRAIDYLQEARMLANASIACQAPESSGQPIIIQVDGRQLAHDVLPHIVEQVRNSVGTQSE